MNRWRLFLHFLRASTLVACGGLWWAKRRLAKRRSIIVLTMHRVLEDADIHRTQSLPGIIMRRPTFEQLAAYVARRYEPVDVSRTSPDQDSAKLRIAFTFDDGWIDNHSTAFPIAQAYGIPMTIFVCPGLAGLNTPFWPERVAASLRVAQGTVRDEVIEQVIERLKLSSIEDRCQAIAACDSVGAGGPDGSLTWERITEMDRLGVVFGSHTHTHQILTAVPESTARLEVLESKAAIERALNKPCSLFAYPNGNHSLPIRTLLAEAGFELAFTARRGPWTAGCDRYAIPRVNVYEGNVTGPSGHFSPAMFEYTLFWRAWRAMETRPRS